MSFEIVTFSLVLMVWETRKGLSPIYGCHFSPAQYFCAHVGGYISALVARLIGAGPYAIQKNAARERVAMVSPGGFISLFKRIAVSC